MRLVGCASVSSTGTNFSFGLLFRLFGLLFRGLVFCFVNRNKLLIWSSVSSTGKYIIVQRLFPPPPFRSSLIRRATCFGQRFPAATTTSDARRSISCLFSFSRCPSDHLLLDLVFPPPPFRSSLIRRATCFGQRFPAATTTWDARRLYQPRWRGKSFRSSLNSCSFSFSRRRHHFGPMTHSRFFRIDVHVAADIKL